MKEIELKVLRFIKKEKLLEKGDSLLVAVSGGIDSIVLLHVLNKLAGSLNIAAPVVAHMNHKLRGAESDRDEKFVKNVADVLGLKFVSQSLNIKKLSQLEKQSIQQTARKYRLKFIEETSVELSCNKIATGHNQDDLAETTIMWIARGSGLKGAAGILPRREKFIRPLLTCSRDEITEFAGEKGTAFIEDTSNAKLDYIRNRFRHEVVPLIEETCYPTARKNIARFAELIRNDISYLENKSLGIMKKLSSHGKAEIGIEIEKLKNLHPAMGTRVIRHMIKEVSGKLSNLSYEHIEKIFELCSQTTGGQKHLNLPGGVEAIKTYSKLSIRPQKTKPPQTTKNKLEEYVLKYPGTTEIEKLNIIVDVKTLPGEKAIETYSFDDPFMTFINLDKVVLPLKIRLPKRGDKFTPLGSSGRKKLSDFFIDSKISADERWNIPLLTDSENIIWVSGYRVNELYRISVRSKNVLMVKLSWI